MNSYNLRVITAPAYFSEYVGAFFLFFIFLGFVNRKAEPYGVALFTSIYTLSYHNTMLQDIIALEKNIETREDYKKAIETYCGWKVAAIMDRMRGNPQNMVMMMCKAVMDFEMGILPQVESDPIAYADGVGVFMEQMKIALNNHYDFDNDTLFNTEYQFLLNYIYHGME